MPVDQMNENHHGALYARYSVIGKHAKEKVVDHVGLLPQATTLVPGANVEVFDSGPPLRVGRVDDESAGKLNTKEMTSALVGWMDLRQEELRGIERVLFEIRTRVPLLPARGPNYQYQSIVSYYIAVPHMQIVPGEEAGSVKHYRFSCAGLVVYLYEEGADIRLVDLERLPPIAFDELIDVWPHLGKITQLLRDAIGFPDEKPRPVLLPGYIFHALQREASEVRRVPYTPMPRDRAFPHSS